MFEKVKSTIRESCSGDILERIIAIKIYIQRKIINRCRYFGFKYKCPVCKSNLRSFLPLPDKFTGTFEAKGIKHSRDEWETLNYRSYRCPVCFANDRARLIMLYLESILRGQCPKDFNVESDNIDNKKPILLHFAPEKGLTNYIKQTNRFKYITTDIRQLNRFRYITTDLSEITNVLIDIQKMSIRNNSIACFICSHVLEHIKDDIKALSELYRVLKDDGWGIVMVPINEKLVNTHGSSENICEEDRLRHYGQKDHFRVYNKRGIIDKLNCVGFEVNDYGAENYFDKEMLKKSGITEKSRLYVLNKPSV